MKINIGAHILSIIPERLFDGKNHFYYCKVDNNPSEIIYTEELLEDMSKTDIIKLYETQNEIITT